MPKSPIVQMLYVLCAMAWHFALVFPHVVPDSVQQDLHSPVMLIVGDVTSSSARVLYDQFPTATLLTYKIFRKTHTKTQSPPVFELLKTDQQTTPLTQQPQVLRFSELTPNRSYKIVFNLFCGENCQPAEHFVSFRTPPNTDSSGALSSFNPQLLVVSCDRFVDDHDDVLWEQLVAKIDAMEASGQYFGVAHIGDQAYTDAGGQRVKAPVLDPKDKHDVTILRKKYQLVLDQFRAIYRQTLGRRLLQQVLRRGAHWMLPDDHEVINNFNQPIYRRVFGASGTIEDRMVLRAGIQAMYEYQFQLRADFPFDQVDFLQDLISKIFEQFPFYQSATIGAFKLLFLDLRFDRSVLPQEQTSLLMSERQFQFLHNELAALESHQQQAIVLSGMPLFFHTPFTASIAEKVDGEIYPGHKGQSQSLDQLRQVFMQHSNRLRLLVGGDIHTLVHSRVCDKSKCLDQLLTSGLTRGSTAIVDRQLVPFYLLVTKWVPFVQSLGPFTRDTTILFDKVFFGRNFGVLELISSENRVRWSSVMVPHDEMGQVLLQFVADFIVVPQFVLSAVALLLTWRVVRPLVSSGALAPNSLKSVRLVGCH